MKLPNGFGSVYKVKGNRRNSWVARVTTGWAEDGKQLKYYVGSYKTRAEAISALTEYNKNPIGERSGITLNALFEEWVNLKYETISKSTRETYNAAWKHLSKLSDMQFQDIKTSHLQDVITSMSKAGLSKSSCHKVKVLAGLLYQYAMADDIVSKNYAELVKLPEETAKGRECFTEIEIKAIEKLAEDDQWANSILILIYTGMRIGELLKLTKFNIDLKAMTITGGSKTEAGKNRTIPIHPKIQNYIRQWYNTDGSYIINRNGQRILVDYYRTQLYYPTLEKAGVRNLVPHSTRHTFASLLSKAGANTKAIQEIIGHADYSTTANIYTHTDLEELRQAIEKI